MKPPTRRLPRQKPAEEKPLERQPLPERSQEEAIALERKIPLQEQQQLQAGTDTFLALWKPANTADPKGAVIIIPGAGETVDWPQAIGPLRRQLPDAQWSSLSITLPDLQSEAMAPRVVQATPAAKAPRRRQQRLDHRRAHRTGRGRRSRGGGQGRRRNQLTNRARLTPNESSPASTQPSLLPNSKVLAALVVLGHGTGAYWAARYLSERQTAQVERFVMVAAQTPNKAVPAHWTTSRQRLKLPTADFFYMDKPLDRNAALARLQASKRLKTSAFSQVSLKASAGQ